ncbi:Dipeptidyl-peptidase [Lachnellula subtilissima]|uniref:Dipeptidyl-peptidase V n=1 Tax=Lachnellula subtilissima TaxID=602034 RepID=A0A8H8U5C6_9HELO|nr:Dipeptidyl-peptidase [Lachnellula subtilissima]
MSNDYQKTDPSRFLAAPRRSGATPNPAGTHALFSLSAYYFDTHRNTAGVYVLDLGSGRSHLLSQDTKATGHVWTGFGSDVLWQKQVAGTTELWIDDAAAPGKRMYRAGLIDCLISTQKIVRLTDDAFAIVALGPKTGVAAPSTYSTATECLFLPGQGLIADSSTERVLWYLRFDVDASQPELHFNLSWHIMDIIRDTGVTFAPYSGIVLMGPTNLDVSPSGLVFAGRTRNQSEQEQRNWTSDAFFLPISYLHSPKSQTNIVLQKLTTEKYSGTVTLPIITSSGLVAFLKNEDRAKMTSKNHIFYGKVSDNSITKELILHTGPIIEELWSLNPEKLMWSNDEKKIFISAADTGRQRAFQLSIPNIEASANDKNIPTALEFGLGSISSIYNYSSSPSDKRILVSKTGFVDSSTFLTVHPPTNTFTILSTLTDCEELGLNRGQVSEFWFQGDGDYQVHSWIIKPSFFQETEKYPLALLIHGGPLSSWQDSWSTRWNPILFAEEGYIVVCPDVTGYNEEFKEAAIREIGGRPYKDIEKCFAYIEKHITCADTSNAVALGGSYGGYLIYWLAGQPFARNFKALVAHAGMFNAATLYASDVPEIWKVLFGGYDSDPSQIVKVFEKWDPAQFAHRWQTPILITHAGSLNDGACSVHFRAMKGVESKFLSFPDEGHFVLKPENSLQWHRVVIDWMNKHTRE